jgi:hypothetical protein
MANQRSSAPDWLFRTLQRAGLRVESGRTPESLIVRLQDSKPIEFDVLAFAVLSLERAQEIVTVNLRAACALAPRPLLAEGLPLSH